MRNAPEQHRLSARQLKDVLQSLRDKTGWQDLYFDDEGFLLSPAPDNFKGGSAAARRLLLEALNASQAYDLEQHNHAAHVTFGQLAPGVEYQSRRTGAQISVYPLQIDFTDFNQLRGDTEALKAFDLGLVILHELGHAVWGLPDATVVGEAGECELYVNRIRRELGLPERLSYFAKARLSSLNSIASTRQIAELVFVRTVEKTGKAPRQERFLLRWETDAVGAFVPAALPARPGLTAAFR